MAKLTKHEITGDRKPVTSLYDLVGLSSNPYGARDLTEYRANLTKMNFSDLQDHAIEVGEVPTDDRERLTDKLERRFIQTTGQLEAAVVNSVDADKELKKKNQLSKAEQKQVQDLLARGRS
jgi:hypothetical protein